MNAPSCVLRRAPQRWRTDAGSWYGGHDAGEDRVLPVVADVRDAVGPADHLTLGSRGGGPRPAVVGDAVDGLPAKVQWREGDERAPRRVVETSRHVGIERVLTGVPAGTVPAVVPEGDRLGQGDVEAAGAGDGGRDLRHFERVREPRPLMVLGKHEDLGLAGEAPEGGGVEDAVAVTFEAGPPWVGLLDHDPVPGTDGVAGTRSQQGAFELLALLSTSRRRARWSGAWRGGSTSGPVAAAAGIDPGAGIGVGQPYRPGVAVHGRSPACTAFVVALRRLLPHVRQSAPCL